MHSREGSRSRNVAIADCIVVPSSLSLSSRREYTRCQSSLYRDVRILLLSLLIFHFSPTSSHGPISNRIRRIDFVRASRDAS